MTTTTYSHSLLLAKVISVLNNTGTFDNVEQREEALAYLEEIKGISELVTKHNTPKREPIKLHESVQLKEEEAFPVGSFVRLKSTTQQLRETGFHDTMRFKVLEVKKNMFNHKVYVLQHVRSGRKCIMNPKFLVNSK